MKTIQEAEKELYFSEGSVLQNNYTSHFKLGVEFAQKWISVKEELPEYYKPVLVKIKHKFYVAWLAYDKEYSFTIYGTDNVLPFNRITHWRPIEYK